MSGGLVLAPLAAPVPELSVWWAVVWFCFVAVATLAVRFFIRTRVG